MRVLITGATGLIGTELTKLCHKKGWSVNYLTTGKHKISKSQNYQGFFWNPSGNEIDTSCFQGVDAIIHLVGANVAKHWTAKYKEEIIKSRTVTTQLLLNEIKKGNYPIKKIISASAIGIYPSSLTNYYDENYPQVNPEFLGKVVSKWEKSVENFSNLDVQVTKLRIGLVLSDKDGALPKMVKPVKFGVGAAFGNGDHWQSWIHIDDLIALFTFVLENNVSGVINAVAPNPVTNEELIKAIAKKLKRPLILPNIPKVVLMMILGEMHQILFDSQRVSSKKIENLGFEFTYNNLKPALESLL